MYDWSKQPRFIIYALTDPRTDEIRYIGRSSTGMGRPLEHRSRVMREKTHKAAWVRSLIRKGLSYGFVVLKKCSDLEESIESEKEFILLHRLFGARLTNHTSGGEGASVKKVSLPDAEIVSRYASGESELALSRLYKVQTGTIRRRLIEAGVEIRNGSAANILRFAKMTYEQRCELTSAAHVAVRGSKNSLGRKATPETRAKMSASHKARLNSN
jgi:hypothetical protein